MVGHIFVGFLFTPEVRTVEVQDIFARKTCLISDYFRGKTAVAQIAAGNIHRIHTSEKNLPLPGAHPLNVLWLQKVLPQSSINHGP
jgi:hypothetical protein